MINTTSQLRDYSADSRILYVSALAAGLGAVSAVAAWLLIDMIRGCTNLVFLHRWSVVRVNPWSVGELWWVPFMPALGGLGVGLIARFLSPNVRGHGMPEAVETIVFKGGRVQPRVAVLKPVATALSIGTGGPFGAEGPVIMTGGAIGSVLGQLLSMTDSERTVLMVAGAASGMAATFNCPMAATLLAVEILLFEWKPRSLVPVALACVTATAVRRLLLGPSPSLNMIPTQAPVYHSALLGALLIGIVAAFFAAGIGKLLHFWEDMFAKLPIHWMWWPAIGGAGVGLLSLIFPQGLGIGHSNMEHMIAGDASVTMTFLFGILIFKTLMWSFSLGSNTAGGILSPLLMIGGALGATMGHFMPFMTMGEWTLVGMVSLLSASIGAPLTAAMLALEMTHNGGLMLPILLACAASYAVSVLVQSRSMLTADMSRRGLHLTRELGVDPLESMLVSQAMQTSVFALPEDATQQHAADWLRSMEAKGASAWSHWQRIFPVVDKDGKLLSVLTRSQMIAIAEKGPSDLKLADAGVPGLRTISPTHTLKACAVSMAESGLTSYPVVSADGKLLGIMTINDLLKGRSQQEMRESARNRILRLRWPFSGHREKLPSGVTEIEPVPGPTVGQQKAAAEAAADEELVTPP